jgi:phage terminase large subunit
MCTSLASTATCIASAKGKGSVTHGFQLVQNPPLSVTTRSVTIIKEYRNHLWISKKDGKLLNEPEHTWSHSLDGIR